MPRRRKEQSPNYGADRPLEPWDMDAEEIGTEYRSRSRRKDMLDFSDLYLTHDDEMRQERGLDW